MQKFSIAVVIAAILALPFAFGCEEHRSVEVEDPVGFQLAVEANRSCARAANYYDFSPDAPVLFNIEVTAIKSDGEVCTEFNRPVRLRVVPGEIENLGPGGTQEEPWHKGAIVHVRNGRVRTQVAIRKAYGDNVRIWAEDTLKRWKCNLLCGEVYWGEEPRTLASNSSIQQCCGLSGIDLFFEEPDDEPTHVGCVSDQICFLTPSIRDTQETDDPLTSPLDGSSVVIDRGELVVTSTVGDGFYFSDLDPMTAGSPPAFNHNFAYNYSFPEGLREGDILSQVTGILGEFFGFTEMSFPTWQKKIRTGGPMGTGEPCRGFDLVTSRGSITVESPSTDFWARGARRGDRLNITLSSYEDEDFAGVYDIDRVQGNKLTLTKPVEITRSNLAFSVTEVYKDTVPARAITASEASDVLLMEQFECGLVEVVDGEIKNVDDGDYSQYGQWPMDIGGGSGADVNVVTQNILPDFDPRENVGKRVQVLRGMLRHHQYADPQWIIYPRDYTDISCPDCDPPL